MGRQPCFVAVHFGAGYHSKCKEATYIKLMDHCCTDTLHVLENSNDLIESLTHGIKILENSGILNAGKGSNKNREGIIEADAALMQIDPPCLGSVGCIKGFLNPINEAKKAFFHSLETRKMSNVIYGIQATDDFESVFSGSRSSCSSLNSDTVGIICVNSNGQMAIGCSSGGPEGKLPGRIGPCAIPGMGFWGIKLDDRNYSALFTGIGEQIIIKGGARSLIEYMTTSSNDMEFSNFLEKLYSSHDNELPAEFGFLSLCVSKARIEIFSSHSTPSFIFGWKSTKDTVATTHISRLNDSKFKSFATCLQIK